MNSLALSCKHNSSARVLVTTGLADKKEGILVPIQIKSAFDQLLCSAQYGEVCPWTGLQPGVGELRALARGMLVAEENTHSPRWNKYYLSRCVYKLCGFKFKDCPKNRRNLEFQFLGMSCRLTHQTRRLKKKKVLSKETKWEPSINQKFYLPSGTAVLWPIQPPEPGAGGWGSRDSTPYSMITRIWAQMLFHSHIL